MSCVERIVHRYAFLGQQAWLEKEWGAIEEPDRDSCGEGFGSMKILFVCSGNTCRSPMGEGLARKMLGSQTDGESAGTHPTRDRAADEAVEVMRSRFGIDISSHRPRNVKDVSVEDFDYVVAMDSGVAGDLRRIYPSINARLISWDMHDPWGGGVEAYERAARESQKHVEEKKWPQNEAIGVVAPL